MVNFDAKRFGAALAEVMAEERVMPLGPGEPNEAARPKLEALTVERALGGRDAVDRDMGRAVLAGAWLYHDFLDESHRISQSIPTPTGSYWHGIMHRREPDASNAGYWFGRVGGHTVFEPLRREAAELAGGCAADEAAFLTNQGTWDPRRFIDLCEKARVAGGELEELCRQVQMAEWRLLMDFCCRRAVGE